MGFLAPAIPWIAQGAGTLLGGLFGKKATSSAQQRSPEEQTGLGGEQGAAGSLAGTGTALTNLGMPGLQQTSNYWQTLLTGNRGQQALATAGPRASLTDIYRGATSNLEQQGIRGATKDRLTGELARDKASKIAGLTTGVQPLAAEQLGTLSSGITAQGGSRTGAAGSIFSDLLGKGFQNRTYARDQGQQAASGAGNLLAGLFGSLFGKKSNTGVAGPYGGGGVGDQGPTPAMVG